MNKTFLASRPAVAPAIPAAGRSRLGILLACAMMVLAFASQPAWAQEAGDAALLERSDNDNFEVPVNKSGVIRVEQAVKRVSVGNPGVADVLVLRSREIYVVGKKIGATNVTLWDRDDRIFATLNITVSQDLGALKAKLHELFPDETIGVQSAQERIILSGQVSSLNRMNAAVDLATGFLSECVTPNSDVLLRDTSGTTPVVVQQGNQGRVNDNQECKKGTVINLMQVGGVQQVMIEIKVAEVARTLLNRLEGRLNFLKFGSDGNFGATSGGASFPATGPSPFTAPGTVVTAPGTIDATGLFGNYLSDNYFLQAFLDISRRHDLAKILAEPTLTTLSGQEAEFLSGGEFPIPVPQGGATSNSITVEFKEFGVGVKFVPVVLDSKRINMKLNVSVSDISQANNLILDTGSTNASFVVPSLTKRSAHSTVELNDGQTIGIAGLISDNVREFVDKFPMLGDIPVLGVFFRSQEFKHDKSELVIFVTPHLAKPIAPSQVRLPTDSFAPPGALEFYLLGRMESGSAPEKRPTLNATAPGGGADGSQFGHDY